MQNKFLDSGHELFNQVSKRRRRKREKRKKTMDPNWLLEKLLAS